MGASLSLLRLIDNPLSQLSLCVWGRKRNPRNRVLSSLSMGRESMAVVESSPPSAAPPPGTAVSATSLAPGFRFHPTDEELVSYYLKRKVLGKPVRFDAIGEVDIYKHEPWDLAGSLSFSRCLFIF